MNSPLKSLEKVESPAPEGKPPAASCRLDNADLAALTLNVSKNSVLGNSENIFIDSGSAPIPVEVLPVFMEVFTELMTILPLLALISTLLFSVLVSTVSLVSAVLVSEVPFSALSPSSMLTLAVPL